MRPAIRLSPLHPGTCKVAPKDRKRVQTASLANVAAATAMAATAANGASVLKRRLTAPVRPLIRKPWSRIRLKLLRSGLHLLLNQ